MHKKFLVFNINAFELVAVNSPYYGENNGMGSQTVNNQS